MPDRPRLDPFGPSRVQRTLAFLRRGALAALAVGLIVSTAVLYLSRSTDPAYEASATLLITHPSADPGAGVPTVTAPRLGVQGYQAAARSSAVLDRMDALTAQEGFVADPDGTLRDRLRASFQEDDHAGLATFTVRHGHPTHAAAIANAWAEAMIAWDRDRAAEHLTRNARALEQQIRTLDAQIAMLEESDGAFTPDQLQSRVDLRTEQQEELYRIRTLSGAAASRFSVLEPATVDPVPVSLEPVQHAILAGLAAIVATYLLLLLAKAADPRLRSSGDVTRVGRLPVLAEFPRLPTGVRTLPRDAVAYLRANLQFDMADAHPKIVLVTSPGEGEGKSSVASSLAVAFARDGQKTLLIDADLRKPVLAETFGLQRNPAPPLAEWLSRPDAEHAPARLKLDADVTMDVIPSFQAAVGPTELLGFGFRNVLDRARSRYDVIVIDSAPVLPVADTLAIAPHCTGTVLVASAAVTTRARLRSAVGLLERLGVRTVGTVATHLPRKPSGAPDEESSYGYGYGYGAKGTRRAGS